MDKSQATETKSDIQHLVAEAVEKALLERLPHTCFTCRWFIMRTEQPHIRVCRFPGELKASPKQCFCWELDPDPKQRHKTVIG